MPTEAQKRWNNGLKGNAPYWRKPKLTPTDRTEIGYLRYEGYTLKELAARYGVSHATIHSVAPVERPWQ